jgi:ABC-type uncharacterized transport system YnjBCD ATPase subunit
MNWREALDQLRDELVALYWNEVQELKPLARDIDLRLGTVDFTGRPIDTCGQMVVEAARQKRIETLVEVVERRFPRRTGPRRALEAYLQAVAARPRVEDLDRFLNRTAELETFASLAGRPQCRLVSMHGQEERGKTRLLDQLGGQCGKTHRVAARVDFRTSQALTDPKKVIARLREKIGGRFNQEMGQAELQIFQYLAQVRAAQERAEDPTPAVSAALARGAGGGFYRAGPQTVQLGDTSGGHQTMIGESDVVSDPGAGPAHLLDEENTQRDVAFRAALRNLQAEQRMILVFDHVDEATGPVQDWLCGLVLRLLTEESEDFPNLWFIVAGCRVFLQDQMAARAHMLQSLEIGPLPEEDVLAFWADEVGLDADVVRDYFADSGGNTHWMCTFLTSRAQRKGLGGAGS